MSTNYFCTVDAAAKKIIHRNEEKRRQRKKPNSIPIEIMFEVHQYAVNLSVLSQLAKIRNGCYLLPTAIGGWKTATVEQVYINERTTAFINLGRQAKRGNNKLKLQLLLQQEAVKILCKFSVSYRIISFRLAQSIDRVRFDAKCLSNFFLLFICSVIGSVNQFEEERKSLCACVCQLCGRINNQNDL